MISPEGELESYHTLNQHTRHQNFDKRRSVDNTSNKQIKELAQGRNSLIDIKTASLNTNHLMNCKADRELNNSDSKISISNRISQDNLQIMSPVSKNVDKPSNKEHRVNNN